MAASKQNDLYQRACAKLFDTYQKSLAPLKAWVESRHPRHDGESEAKYEGRLRSKYVDNCRYLLPAAALANVGMTANARVIENAIRKMLSHPLAEVREIGEEVKKVALGETPTLVKYAERVPYLADVQNRKSQIPKSQNLEPRAWITLNDYDKEGEVKFLAAFLYRFGGMSFEEAFDVVSKMNDDQRTALAHDALGGLDKYDAPVRELEHITYTFDVVMDQGAYFELKRHRMMTQTPQRLTADLGWATPAAFERANFCDEYESAMQIAAEAYHALAADFPEEASYVVPNGFNRRVLMTLNLRQAFALCELRTTPGAHFAVRRITAKMYEKIRDVHPLLSKFIRCGERPRSEEIEKEFFVS
jgi:thymidylate synthase ThyX